MGLNDLVDEYAPGLRTLGDTLGGLRHAIGQGDVGIVADPTNVDAYVPLIAIGVFGFLVVCLLLRVLRLRLFPEPLTATQRRAMEDKDEIHRPTNTSLWRRLWWRIRPPHDLMRVDGLVIDRTGKRSHALWPGPTGAGKSESVATVRCDGARPWLAVMPDVSDPLRGRADFIWTAGESQAPIDFLNGTPEDVAERLTTVFRSGGNGVWMMAAREAATQVIRGLDLAHEPRSLQAIGAGVEELVESNRRLKTACEGWVTRFLATAMAMGPSVAAGGVDIADLLRAGKGVVIDNDRWKHPGLCGDTVAFGLAEAKRIGDLVPGGFRLIFEEADQLGERIDLADPFFAAGRRRKIAVDALLHAEEDADDAMATNSATRVYFRPNKPEQRAKVAKALDLSESVVDAIPDYHAWIEHDGKVRRLVHFPKPPKREDRPETPSTQPGTVDRISVTKNKGVDTEKVDTVGEDRAEAEGVAERVVYGPPEMPRVYVEAPVPEKLRGQLLNIWTRHVFPGGLNGCYESTYRRNNSGRPGCSFGGADWTTYVLLKCLEDARCEGVTGEALPGYLSNIQRQTAAGELTVDHSCENERCDRVEHLSWQSRSRNSELYHERKRKQREEQKGDA